MPHDLWSAGLDYRPDEAWKLSFWANGQGAYYVERTNTLGRFGQATLLNVGVTYRWSPTIDLQVQVKNLANRKTVYAWYDSGSSGFSPGDGRGVFASVGRRF